MSGHKLTLDMCEISDLLILTQRSNIYIKQCIESIKYVEFNNIILLVHDYKVTELLDKFTY